MTSRERAQLDRALTVTRTLTQCHPDADTTTVRRVAVDLEQRLQRLLEPAPAEDGGPNRGRSEQSAS